MSEACARITGTECADGAAFRLPRLAALFGLCPAERDALMFCFAPHPRAGHLTELAPSAGAQPSRPGSTPC